MELLKIHQTKPDGLVVSLWISRKLFSFLKNRPNMEYTKGDCTIGVGEGSFVSQNKVSFYLPTEGKYTFLLHGIIPGFTTDQIYIFLENRDIILDTFRSLEREYKKRVITVTRKVRKKRRVIRTHKACDNCRRSHTRCIKPIFGPCERCSKINRKCSFRPRTSSNVPPEIEAALNLLALSKRLVRGH